MDPPRNKTQGDDKPTESPGDSTPTAPTTEETLRAIAVAVDYRGDVTITRISTDESVEGFVFDHRPAAPGDTREGAIRIMLPGAEKPLIVPESDIGSIEFTGRDTAAGESFQGWARRYVKARIDDRVDPDTPPPKGG